MGIVEFGNVKKFIEEVKKIHLKEKDKGRTDRYRLIIATGNRRAVLRPTVTTQKVDTLLLRGIDNIDAQEIKKAGKGIGIDIIEPLNFWFDERKEPPILPPEE